MSFLNRLQVLTWRCALAGLLSLGAQAQAQGTAPAPTPVTSANIAEVGHSLVNTTMPAMFVQVAQSLQKQIQLTVQIINGAPLSWQWNNHTQAQRGSGNPAFADLHAAIPTLRPEVLILTERVDIASTIRWENTNGYVAMWVARARSANPNVRPYLYTTWYGWGNSQWYPGTPTRADWRARIEADGALYEQVATTAGMQIVPGHRAMMALYDAIQAGQVPGFTSINAFFTDDIHLNGMGNYYIALVHYATIYKASPVGAAVPANAGVSTELALQLQQMAWSVVSGYRLSGVTPPAPVDGTCGPANGGSFSTAPAVNLCTAGTASAVTGSGPYAWTCAGTDGGTTASCSATRPAPTPVNGACGAANGQPVRTSPVTGLCAAGTASTVMGSGPFAWSCAGSNGGSTAGCSAPLLASTLNGVCGAASGGSFTSAPSTNLCLAGTATAVSGTGPFTWGCAGANGGTNASCSAVLTPPPPPMPVAGACGAASGVPSLTTPTAALCAVGSPSAVTGTGPFAWSCAGLNGGPAASCAAPLLVPAVAGVCGSSNGGTFPAAPTANLCQAGTATAVTGTGPYAWSCTGSNGAASASCQANRTPTVTQPTVVTNTIGTLARGVSRYFTFTVPAGTRSVSFVLTGTAGDSDLYVSLGSQRPRNSATWRSTSWSPNDQVTLTQPSAGTYYVEVYGYANTTGVVLRTTITPQ